MSDMMAWWQYMDAVRWNLNRYACELGTIQTDIKEKSYSIDAAPSDMPT